MQTQSKQYPQNLQWTELTPQIVSEWNLHDYIDLYLSRVDVERVVKMQVMTFSSVKREYNIRFFDVHENKDDGAKVLFFALCGAAAIFTILRLLRMLCQTAM